MAKPGQQKPKKTKNRTPAPAANQPAGAQGAPAPQGNVPQQPPAPAQPQSAANQQAAAPQQPAQPAVPAGQPGGQQIILTPAQFQQMLAAMQPVHQPGQPIVVQVPAQPQPPAPQQPAQPLQQGQQVPPPPVPLVPQGQIVQPALGNVQQPPPVQRRQVPLPSTRRGWLILVLLVLLFLAAWPSLSTLLRTTAPEVGDSLGRIWGGFVSGVNKVVEKFSDDPQEITVVFVGPTPTSTVVTGGVTQQVNQPVPTAFPTALPQVRHQVVEIAASASGPINIGTWFDASTGYTVYGPFKFEGCGVILMYLVDGPHDQPSIRLNYIGETGIPDELSQQSKLADQIVTIYEGGSLTVRPRSDAFACAPRELRTFQG